VSRQREDAHLSTAEEAGVVVAVTSKVVSLLEVDVGCSSKEALLAALEELVGASVVLVELLDIVEGGSAEVLLSSCVAGGVEVRSKALEKLEDAEGRSAVESELVEDNEDDEKTIEDLEKTT
jgi:hypothetical protein